MSAAVLCALTVKPGAATLSAPASVAGACSALARALAALAVAALVLPLSGEQQARREGGHSDWKNPSLLFTYMGEAAPLLEPLRWPGGKKAKTGLA